MRLPTWTMSALLVAITVAVAGPAPLAAHRAIDGVLPVSDRPVFDSACAAYYSQANDPDVSASDGVPESFCKCLASYYGKHGLGPDALEFFARTYSDDLTTFIDDYPLGETWMQQSFKAETSCKAG